MNKWLVRFFLVISSIILISGCTSGGSLPAEEEKDDLFPPLPSGLPVFVEISEPFIGTSEVSPSQTALFSYKTQKTTSGVASNKEVFSSSIDLIVALNTSADTSGENEFTLIAKNDSIYLVNHDNNELRFLTHFTTQVCDILPIDKVTETESEFVDDITNEIVKTRTLTTLHAERVYVVTADDGQSVNACENTEGKKRYYELPLDYQVDLGVDDDDEINPLNLVDESLARSKLIFGWVPDAPVDNVPTDKVDYAYLGFDSESQYLTLYDKEQNIIWSQKRKLQAFDVVDIGQGQKSSKYIFNVQALENQFYLVQLGLDIFVVDSGLELLTKLQSQSEKILTDKVLTLSTQQSSDKTYGLPVVIDYDDQNLFIFDEDSKIYRSEYLASARAINPSKITYFVGHNPLNFDGDAHVSRKSFYNFSQFNLKDCETDDLECQAAHDVEALDWQFFTACEEQYGCSIEVNVDDFCETLTEKQQTQSNKTLCSPTDYRHLAELNDPANDASFQAYMQYADKYVSKKIFQLNDDQIFLTARMDHKDVFLAYNYNIDFSQPKSLRENVFFGKRASLVGMDANIFGNNLYLTALQQSSVRSNECYKNGQKVTCELGELAKEGSIASCTGRDLNEGKCTNQFKEYESKAILCTEAQLDDMSCSDFNLSQIDSLAVESAEEDAKWLPLYDYPTGANKMFLLVGSNASAVENYILDEGRLFAPSLYNFDTGTGQKGDEPITTLEGPVEQVVGGWLSRETTAGVSEVYGHIDIIAEEIRQIGGTNSTSDSILDTYLLKQIQDDSDPDNPFDIIKAPKVGQRFF